MAIAGTLAVNILARTKEFIKGIKGARKSLGGFSKSIKAITSGVTGFGTALIGAAGVAGFGVFVSKTLESVDSLAKISDKLGIAIEDLGRWRFAAGLAGISTNTLDMALQRMVRRIGQAAQGTGEAQKVLQKFGLDAKELVQLNPSKQFELIGQHVNAITNKGEQLAAAMSLFDSEGVGLVNLFASNLGDAATEFERLGLALSRADAAKIEQFNDAASKLRQSISAAGRDFIIGITPFALEAVKGLQVLMEDLRAKPRGEKGETKRSAFFQGAQLAGADVLRSISTGQVLPLAKSFRESQRLERELAGPRLSPEQFQRDNRQRADERAEQKKQTRILIETLEIQRRAVLDRAAVVVLEPATFE